MTKIIPRANQVLIKPDGEESRNLDSGLIVPSSVDQEQRSTGKVLMFGDEVKDIKMGDRVIYGAYVGEKISLKEKEKKVDYILVLDEDVLAFLED